MQIDEITREVHGRHLLLRNAREEDAGMLLEYLKTTCSETRFLVKEPEEITLTIEEERKFIQDQNASPKNLLLLGFVNGEHVGNCSYMGRDLSRYKHRVSIGIALYQKYTGLGIGGAMIEVMINVARKNKIEQIELEVAANNERAISLYKKMGFEIFGTLPHAMKYQDGSYADEYWMMKNL